MNDSTLFLGYDPRCSLYKRERTPGKPMWYISYYLPNGKRMQRPVHKKSGEARKLMRIKELQLLQGVFDSKDKKKMEGFLTETVEENRLTIDDALMYYEKITESRKTPATIYQDKLAADRYFGFFKKGGRRFLDEITAYDVSMLIRSLDKAGKSESTIGNAATLIKKVFNCFIEEMEFRVDNKVFREFKNPVSKKTVIPKKSGKVRVRLPSDKEIKAILNAPDPLVTDTSSLSPIKSIVYFLVCTGARLGEALHAEWPDFDLDRGIWKIRFKPNCPTKYRLGWSPKWKKERDVILFREAVDLLRSMPIVKSTGTVNIRDENRKIVDRKTYPADFVFPKKEVVRNGKDVTVFYTRVDSIKKSWGTLKDNAKVTDLQIKDLRTYFNHLLKSKYGFSTKEAGAYIGNSQEINDKHYTPVSLDAIQQKISSLNLSEVIGAGETESVQFLN